MKCKWLMKVVKLIYEKELLIMLFLAPLVASAVESALAYESASMFVAGAASATSVFRRD